MDTKKRNPGADIIRILALFFVISVHFFLNSEFYSQIMIGKRMLIMTIMRSLFIICVPLFLTLSGYLLRKKQLNKNYYARIIKILLTYILAGIACTIFSVFFLHQDFSIKKLIFSLFNFTAAPYAWYIEMYLGLFLLIPFLNLIYQNLPSKKWKLVLIASFIFLTSLPSVLNAYHFNTPGWWANPTISYELQKFIPDWWIRLYPVTYYFLGCYLNEYGLKINRILNFFLIVLTACLSGLYSFWRSYETIFVNGAWNDYYSLFNIILTILIFAFFINFNYEKVPPKFSRFLQKVSGLSLGGYLLSFIFDTLFYPILNEKISYVPQRLEAYFIIVPCIFICSLLASYIISKIQFLLEKCLPKR